MAAARSSKDRSGESTRVGGRAHELTDVVTRLRRALRASIRSDYSWEQLPMAQVEMLQVLAETSPQRISAIAARQKLTPGTVSSLIGQLMETGLVDRAVDVSDRRASAVSLTPAGRRQLDAWMQAHERRIHQALDRLSASQRQRLDAALPSLERLADLLLDLETDPETGTRPDPEGEEKSPRDRGATVRRR